MASVENFRAMTETDMREWVNANPGKVNDIEKGGPYTLLVRAAQNASSSFVAELVDTYGADVHKGGHGITALLFAFTAAMVSALLERGADPAAAAHRWGQTPLMFYARSGFADCVERILQELGTLATIDIQCETNKYSALHYTLHGRQGNEAAAAEITKLLLLAGADPFIRDWRGRTPLGFLQWLLPNIPLASKSILQEAMTPADGGRTFMLHKARHLSDAAHALAKTAPCTLTPRMPRIELAPPQQRPSSHPSGSIEAAEQEKIKKRRAAVLRYVLRLEEGGGSGGGGSNTDGMPSEVFYELLKMMGPSYYPVAEGAGSDGKV